MARVFQKTMTQWFLRDVWIGPDGQICPEGTPGARYIESKRVRPHTPGAKKEAFKTKKFYGRVPGSRDPKPLAENRKAAEAILEKMIAECQLGAAGIDPATVFLDESEQPASAQIASALADAWLRGYEAGRSLRRRPARPDLLELFVSCGKNYKEDLIL